MTLDDAEWNALVDAFGLTAEERASLRKLGLAPLLWERGEGYVLCRDGRVSRYGLEGALSNEPLLRMRNIALLSAARFVPKIGAWIERPEKTSVCPACHGSGTAPGIPDELIGKAVCYCGGLGWIPAGE